MPKLAREWSVAEVCEYLDQLGLGHLAPVFRDNAVTGKDLLELSDEDLKSSLGLTPLQVRKIRSELPAREGAAAPQAPAPAPAPAVAAPAPVAAAAAPPAQAQQAQQHAEVYGRAAASLRAADSKLSAALGSLKTTQVMGAMDTVHDRRVGRMGRMGDASPAGIRHAQRGGIGGDMIEMATVHRANEQVKAAAADVEAARSLIPTLPFIQPATLGSAKAGVFQNMLFGGSTASNVLQMAQVKKSAAAIEQMQGQVRQALQWIQSQGAGAAYYY